ncbi:MAG: RluA family pseudouridine synthase [Spirochaetales bacterium]|jgi:23S rRNA pseudouridine1911/1915/1917 synthase|nr:RluA family pseudouridine synthase [Spirochaetales bacterium]
MLDPGQILYEDNHLIVLNKKCSEIVQADNTGDESLADMVKAYIKARDGKPGKVFLGVCHRIDRPTSGVVIFAKTSKALSRINELFRDGKVKKTYWAVVAVPPPKSDGKLVHFLMRNQQKNKSFPVEAPAQSTPGGKRAELHFTVLAESDRYTLLEIHPKTGRHHQIRVQLSAVGSPIKGDLKYGAPRSNTGGGIYLHARAAEFEHPVKKELLRVVAPVPNENLWKVFEELFR